MNHYQVSPCCLRFFFFKWKLFNLTSWHFWGFRTKLIAAAAAWSAVTKKPNSIINPCVSNLGDSGFPGEAVLFAVSHLLLPGVSLWELVVFRVFFLIPSSEVCEVPTGPREPRAQAEMVGLRARNPEGGLSRLASPGGHEASGYVVCVLSISGCIVQLFHAPVSPAWWKKLELG